MERRRLPPPERSLTSHVPIVVMSSNGHGDKLKARYSNVVRTIPKPVSAETLLPVVSTQLAEAKAPPPPSSVILFRDASKVVFAAHTGFFSLRNALQMAYGDKMTGVLRVFINRFPVELFFSKGRFLFATTRNFHLYLRDSPSFSIRTDLGLVMEGQANQGASGCPLFLFLAGRNGFPHDDVSRSPVSMASASFHLWTARPGQFRFSRAWRISRLRAQFSALGR